MRGRSSCASLAPGCSSPPCTWCVIQIPLFASAHNLDGLRWSYGHGMFTTEAPIGLTSGTCMLRSTLSKTAPAGAGPGPNRGGQYVFPLPFSLPSPSPPHLSCHLSPVVIPPLSTYCLLVSARVGGRIIDGRVLALTQWRAARPSSIDCCGCCWPPSTHALTPPWTPITTDPLHLGTQPKPITCCHSRFTVSLRSKNHLFYHALHRVLLWLTKH
jgi:hypothetical protein